MDARQRIASLLQGGSFTEVGQLAGGEVDAFIAGIGSLNGRPVAGLRRLHCKGWLYR